MGPNFPLYIILIAFFIALNLLLRKLPGSFQTTKSSWPLGITLSATYGFFAPLAFAQWPLIAFLLLYAGLLFAVLYLPFFRNVSQERTKIICVVIVGLAMTLHLVSQNSAPSPGVTTVEKGQFAIPPETP